MFVAIAVAICPYHVIMMQLYVEYSVCAIVQFYDEMFAVLYVVETVTLRVAPVAAIAVLNAFIIGRVTRLTRDKNRRRRQLALKSTGTGTANGNGTDCLRLVVTEDAGHSSASQQHCQQNHHQHNSHPKPKKDQQAQHRRGSIDDRNLQLTIILILVSSSYILAYLPVLIHFVMVKMKMNKWIATSEETLTIFGNYGKTAYIGGFAINFFLYTMSGRVFRDQLCGMLCSRRAATGRDKRGPNSEYVAGCGGCGRTAETTVNVVAEMSSAV